MLFRIQFRTLLLGLSFSLISTIAIAVEQVAGSCPDPMSLIAEYKVSYVGAGEKSEAFTLTLVRYKGAVLQANSALQVADQWFREGNGRISRIQYFDKYQQGIEYASKEANDRVADTDWKTKFSLLNDEALARFVVTSEERDDCLVRENMKMGDDGEQLVTWRGDLKLPEKWTLNQRDGVSSQLELVSLNFDIQAVESLFRQREGYKLTDYADIGDSEDNPEIQKMLSGHLVEHDHHH